MICHFRNASMNKKIKVIAYYLPQFHPIPENDEWWGKGFTEWTNVGKAKPLFKGHKQPIIPKDLGYYDLRVPEVRNEQARLAKEAGIEGFCYWHYWFGEGKRLLEMPFNEVISSGEPDFPFCLGWANESWLAKLWNNDSSKDKILIEQKYPGEEDMILHFNTLKVAFEDKRYIRIDDRPVFLIYRPLLLKDNSIFIKLWNKLLNEAGLGKSFYFIAQANSEEEYAILKDTGFDAVTISPTKRMLQSHYNKNIFSRYLTNIHRKLRNVPLILKYSTVCKYLYNDEFDSKEDVIPFILPNWDHSPRSGGKAVVLHKSTPSLFRKYIKQVFSDIRKKNNKLVFLKSWNEWAEGNYMEPDLHWGDAYLKVLKEEIENNEIQQ